MSLTKQTRWGDPCVLQRDQVGSLSFRFPILDGFLGSPLSPFVGGRIEDLSASLAILPGIDGSAATMYGESQKLRVKLVGSANVELTWLLQP